MRFMMYFLVERKREKKRRQDTFQYLRVKERGRACGRKIDKEKIKWERFSFVSHFLVFIQGSRSFVFFMTSTGFSSSFISEVEISTPKNNHKEMEKPFFLIIYLRKINKKTGLLSARFFINHPKFVVWNSIGHQSSLRACFYFKNRRKTNEESRWKIFSTEELSPQVAIASFIRLNEIW